MPYIWTQTDTRNAIISSFLPASTAIAGYCSLSCNGSSQSFIEVCFLKLY